MSTINFYQQEDWKINTKKIEDVIKKTLQDNGIASNYVVNVAIVDDQKMEDLNKKYYKDKVYEHPIFTFPATIDDFVFPPDKKHHLGEIILLYTSEPKLLSLAQHGTLHLVGIHHTP